MHLQPCATAEIRTDRAALGAARATPWRPRSPARAARDPGRAKPAVAVGAALPASMDFQNHLELGLDFFPVKSQPVLLFSLGDGTLTMARCRCFEADCILHGCRRLREIDAREFVRAHGPVVALPPSTDPENHRAAVRNFFPGKGSVK